MQIYKDRGTLSGYRLEVPVEAGLPVSHIGEYLLAKDHGLAAHSHRTWELLLQTGGSSTWAQGNRQVKVGEWELLICPPGLPHGKDRRETADFRILWTGCQMDPELWPLLKMHLSEKRMTTLPEAQETAMHLRMLEGELLFQQARQKEGVILAWKKLWLAIYRLTVNPRRIWSQEEGWLVHRVRTLVEAEPGERWTLPAVSRLMGYAPNYFAELFKRESGQSFHQYLIAARIEAAKKALKMGEESVTETALRLGFSSSQHFSRAFAKANGIPPTLWAARLKSKPRAQPIKAGGH